MLSLCSCLIWCSDRLVLSVAAVTCWHILWHQRASHDCHCHYYYSAWAEYVIVTVCLPVRLSLCRSVSRITHERVQRMSTKRGRHGQGMTLWKWLIFGANPDPDVDLWSVFHLTLGDRHFHNILSIYCHSPGGGTAAALADMEFYMICAHLADMTMQRP